MKRDRINLHEDWQSAGFIAFLSEYWKRKLGKPFPIAAAPKGSLRAEINYSRWLVKCPNCNEATVVSKQWPFWACPSCGSPENEGRMYRIVFPANAALIEHELMKRPDPRNRNWELTETVETLRAENATRGIK